VELNRAAAIAMRDGAEAGLILIECILARGDLTDYPLAHSACGELYRKLGRSVNARDAFERALSLSTHQSQRRFLERRLAELAEIPRRGTG